jgi:hypothetical protein
MKSHRDYSLFGDAKKFREKYNSRNTYYNGDKQSAIGTQMTV